MFTVLVVIVVGGHIPGPFGGRSQTDVKVPSLKRTTERNIQGQPGSVLCNRDWEWLGSRIISNGSDPRRHSGRTKIETRVRQRQKTEDQDQIRKKAG